MTTKQEENLSLWKAWKQNPTPENLQSLFQGIDPIIKSETFKWNQSIIDPLVLRTKARSLVYKGIQTYDPEKSQLNTHIIHSMKPLSRFVLETQNIVRTPEIKVQGYRRLLKLQEELSETLGRPVTQEELNEVMNSHKIQSFKPLVENFYAKTSESGMSPIMDEITHSSTALTLLYDTLSPKQQLVFKYRFGYKNAPILQGKDIAKRLGVSAAAVSKSLRQIENKYKHYQNSVQGLIG